MSTTLFLILRRNLQKLKEEVLTDPEAKGLVKSVSDIVPAFFWRASIRSRYRVAKELRGQIFRLDELSIQELPIDGRPYFSSVLPSSYMGSMLILNQPTMPIEMLCSPTTTIGRIAYVIREAAARITPSLLHDAFTLLQSMTDYSKPATANMGIEHMNAMISNLMLSRQVISHLATDCLSVEAQKLCGRRWSVAMGVSDIWSFIRRGKMAAWSGRLARHLKSSRCSKLMKSSQNMHNWWIV